MKTIYELSSLADNHNVGVCIMRHKWQTGAERWSCALEWRSTDNVEVKTSSYAASQEGAFAEAWTKLEKVMGGEKKNEFNPALEYQPSPGIDAMADPTPPTPVRPALDDEIPF